MLQEGWNKNQLLWLRESRHVCANSNIQENCVRLEKMGRKAATAWKYSSVNKWSLSGDCLSPREKGKEKCIFGCWNENLK